jgi:eukaryotic-like serine/threonine-protein kinase
MTQPLRQQTAAPISHPSFIRVRDILPGAVIGERYQLGAKLAEGGMGCIYHAMDLCEERPVAVKLLRPEVASNPELRQRFLNEARGTMCIAHPNVIEIMDLGELADGSTYYVMELLAGRTLDECGPLDLGAVLAIALQLCEGLSAAHDKGMVHRDLKPENVIVQRRDDGSVACKLIDFGVAKLAFCGSLTLPGQVMGTPAYLAPEQARAVGGIDVRTDIYSLGVVLYELIAGRLPFVCEDLLQLLLAHQFEPAPALVHPACPPRLAAAIMRCLEKDPARRFQSMRELADELRLAGTPSLPPPATEVEPTLPESPLAALVDHAPDSARTVVFARQPSSPELPRIEEWPRPPVSRFQQSLPWLVPVLVLVALTLSIALTFAILAA